MLAQLLLGVDGMWPWLRCGFLPGVLCIYIYTYYIRIEYIYIYMFTHVYTIS